MFERPDAGNRAVLVQPVLASRCRGVARATGTPRSASRSDGAAIAPAGSDLAEFSELAQSAGAVVAEKIRAPLRRLDPAHLLGKGKIEEIRSAIESTAAELVLINHELSAVQQRNLEQCWACRVVDRTGLILDIFALRAQSHEGKLQVELAQLRYLSTRLVRGWTHLERQKGGIGLRGPGETQLETDRRLLAGRMRTLKGLLEKVDRQRRQTRRARSRRDTRVVALVGYTNAGKSTLFSALTGAEAWAADQLFATLDTSTRKLDCSGGDAVVLVDTVGFISNLPHDLVAAFKATLNETLEADLLLHVIDAADPDMHQHIDDVMQVLADIGAGEVPCLAVYNKMDLQTGVDVPVNTPSRMYVSAALGSGLPALRQAMLDRLSGGKLEAWITLPLEAGRLRAALYTDNLVADECWQADGSASVHIHASRAQIRRLCARLGNEATALQRLLAGGRHGKPLGA